MPLYAYKCVKCGNQFEKIEKMDAPTRQKCPRCKGRAERQISSPAFQFKGSGWYVTDYSGKGREAEKSGDGKDAGPAKDAKDGKETKDTAKETAKESKDEKPRKEKKAAKEK